MQLKNGANYLKVLAWILLLLLSACGNDDTSLVDSVQVDAIESSATNQASSSSKRAERVCVTINGVLNDCSTGTPLDTAANQLESSSSLGPDQMMDERDGKIYKIVTIGHQVWLAENMRYWRSDIASGTYIVSNRMGYYYSQETAKKVCPIGWHLPSLSEWQFLLNSFAAKSVSEDGKNYVYEYMGTMLKSKDLWDPPYTGEDELGFNALPAGYTVYEVLFSEGSVAVFWTSTQTKFYGMSAVVEMDSDHDYAMIDEEFDEYALSVRCIYGKAKEDTTSGDIFPPKVSSSSAKSSSSVKTGSSSSFWDERWEAFEDDIGTVYPSIVIGKQKWMARNLDYKTQYMDQSSAMQLCPTGWHLPTEREWAYMLSSFADPRSEGSSVYYSHVGSKLKSSETWVGKDIGSNELGFDARAIGFVNEDGDTLGIGQTAKFWTASAYGDSAIIVRLVNNDNYAEVTKEYPKSKLPVRCVSDETLFELSSSSLFTSSSSSAAEVKPDGTYDCSPYSYYDCITTEYLDPNMTYMDVMDARENKVYKAIQIDTLYWLAQNLDYHQSGCYSATIGELELSNHKLYGYMYPWKQAKDACMAGWRIPTKAEYEALFEKISVGDELGLAIRPTGYGVEGEEGYVDAGTKAYFWTSTEYVYYAFKDEFVAQYDVSTGRSDVSWASKLENLMAVRCVREVN
ncbi:MAG: hypothetical protein MJZ25_12080 [Fibrobacter sp.]|nr:hypothetical protein [Fibrobacter sp.]